MKKFFISMILIAVGISYYAQSPQRFVNLTPAYPLAIGEVATEGTIYSSNGIYVHDIIQDSLPVYEIGQIFDQTVDFTVDGHGFYVKSDSLHSSNITYNIAVDSMPAGPIDFNNSTGRFKYYPAAEDYRTFFVTFSATNGRDSVSEIVKFILRPQVVPESFAFQSRGVLPDGMDYTIIAESSVSMDLNNENRTAYSYSISGKDIVFDNNVQNKVWGLSSREDIYEMNIFAEKLIIRSALKFPQTNITIYAKEIVFEDNGGEIASINTSPSSLAVLTNDIGKNGSNAGNITMYIKKLSGNMAKRFILNGGQGQCTNRNGTPGNGGNGGILTCNLDIEPYCDFARGSCGVKYNADNGNASLLGEIIGSGQIGSAGHLELEYAPYAYLHPYYVQATIRYINDAFINNYTDYVSSTCEEYSKDITEYLNYYDCDTCYSEYDLQLSNNLSEIEDVLFKINMGLDYFGYPVGWVPLLSFEVMLENFDNEIDRAMPTLYMNYWLTHIDMSLQHLIAASEFAASTTENEIQELQDALNRLVSEIPILQDEAADVQRKINEVQQKIDILRDQLMAKARHKVKKKNRIKKAVQICKGVANVLPVLGPWGAAASAGINAVLSSGILDGLTNLGIDCSSPLDNMAISADSHIMEDIQGHLSSAMDAIGNLDFEQVGDAYKNLKTTAQPLVNNLMELNNVVSHGSAPKDQVEAVFNALCAESAEWKALESDMDSLNICKINLYNHIKENTTNIKCALTDISGDILALDAFRRDAFVGNCKRDLNAMQYIEKMEQRAKNRLIKYHYYLRKAYEYRMLKPYEGEYNLVSMFERFETLATTMNYDSIVDMSNYAAMSAVFKDVISRIAEEVIDEYSNNYPEQSAPITIAISREQLDAINSSDNIILNFYEMGIFSPDEENVRIVDLGIQHIETHVEGNIGYTGYMDFNMTHQGISRFRKDGQIYWFDHMSRTTTSPHTWGIRYDAISNESTNIQPSFASQSLLYSIIDNSNNIMLFSRPSAWGDIILSKKTHTAGGANIVIDSLVLRLQYDFTRRPSNIRNIDITANENLLPFIACSEADINGRSNGYGDLNRSYIVSGQPVTFTAIEQYGSYYFVNWTDRAGNVVSITNELNANRTTDQFYRANYERRVPILSVPDTIRVGFSEGTYAVNVRNIGTDEIEMDWYVSDSLSTWIHLNGINEGIDDGTFTFSYEADEDEVYRIDSLEIFAPETDIMSKYIYVVQGDSDLGVEPISNNNIINIYPNPTNGYVTIEGSDIEYVHIFSIEGKEIGFYNLGGSNYSNIDFSSFQNGIYLLIVKTQKGITRNKIIKTN
ncbi:MAG: T9SS type A sorting domain-containing protein [Bacteroidales bacterium]|nr:T9SS type A sorting domain-containing protein [Bacteroidales bacterium]